MGERSLFPNLLAVQTLTCSLIDLLTMKVMCPQVLVVLWLGLMAVVGGSRVDGGGKPVARKSVGPRDLPALPPAVAPGGGTPAVAPAGPPALPDTSEGVPPVAALPVAAPADVVAEEIDEYRGFQDHWFNFAMPSFCQPIPTRAPAAREPLSKEHAATWKDLAPYIRKTLTRRDGGGDNRFLAFFRHAALPMPYDTMATEASLHSARRTRRKQWERRFLRCVRIIPRRGCARVSLLM